MAILGIKNRDYWKVALLSVLVGALLRHFEPMIPFASLSYPAFFSGVYVLAGGISDILALVFIIAAAMNAVNKPKT